MNTNICIDFDSTIISVEILEIISEIALAGQKDRDSIISQIYKITDLGMEGKISFNKSLNSRLSLLNIDNGLIKKAERIVGNSLATSFKSFLSKIDPATVYVVSGGFEEIIRPVLEPLGVLPGNIFANKFVNQNGRLSVDNNGVLAHNHGKAETIRRLNLTGKVIMVGDGNSDLEVKQAGLADYFVYYSEFVDRESIKSKADFVVGNFNQLHELIKTL